MNRLFKQYFFTLTLLATNLLFSQDGTPDLTKPNKYLLGGITVTGTNEFSEASVISYSGLKNGQEIKIPGDKLTSAIKKLHKTKKFSDVEVYVNKLDGNTIYLEIAVKELPQINKITFLGVSKSRAKTFQKDTELETGKMLTENLITSTENYIKQYYVDKGYLKATTRITTKPNAENANQRDAIVRIDKGELVKIEEIITTGNKEFENKDIRKALKDTKRKYWGRFWKRSKYVEKAFEEDKLNLIEKYRRKGFRDARVTSDSITWNEGLNTINLHIAVEEGKKYFYKDILFLGNKSYNTDYLQRLLKIKKGDIYDSQSLEERVKGDGSPDSEDISTLYQNNGYLFSQVNLVETKVENDSITVEIRIHEDEPATISHVSVKGNERTNDHVIFRELRTRPGDLYSKDNVIRSIRELGQMGFFDAENITPDLKPNYADKTVAIEYSLEEKGSSQIELQGGYGGGSFIGTLGLSFNNFSIRNLLKKEEYKPLPLGDGQQLSLRLQASRFNTSNSISFTEPWLGGKKPRSFSFSIYNQKQYGYGRRSDGSTNFNEVNRDQQLNIFGITLGIGERLKWPDDYFSINNSISYRRYKVDQFLFGSNISFDNNSGVSHNLSYNMTLQRNSAGPSLIFPRYGSTFTVETKITPPYSLFSDKKYETNNEKFELLEYYKINLKAKWYTALIDKFVLMTTTQFGYLGSYNDKKGEVPFERYFVGGDGLNTNNFDGREVIGLRGYSNSSLSGNSGVASGDTVYDKFSMEVRYPITLKPAASIYALGFVEAGNSYRNFSTFNPFDVKKSAGMGIRIFMPAFGLLGIDFGYGFDNEPGVFEKSGWNTHFIIGQQF